MTCSLDPLNSTPITRCQICGGEHLQSVLFIGHVPPVNAMAPVGARPDAELRFPLELLRCPDCTLVQIGYDVDQRILFPHSYPYLSGTTRILRDNFRNLAQTCAARNLAASGDLVVDIGANDGTLLAPFRELGCNVLGVEPSQAGDVAASRGIPIVKDYFSTAIAQSIVAERGRARVITAANVFAHITDIHAIGRAIRELMSPDGVFISENHYLLSLIETLQYDAVYHEHLRYYSIGSLAHLFAMHGLAIFHVERIPTHGGSIRVFAAAEGSRPREPSVAVAVDAERRFGLDDGRALSGFRERVLQSKLDLMAILAGIKRSGHRIFGVGAPSRSSTLVTYVGLDDGIIDCVVEVEGSHKLNKYMPGTRIPVLPEEKLYRERPEYALLLSWHIADELAENLRRRGYDGRFITPLPNPAIL